MSAADRIVSLQSDIKGEGMCAVCHKPRSENGCWSSWKTELQSDKTWEGRVCLWCKSFATDREPLAEALNRYHVRPSQGEGDDE